MHLVFNEMLKYDSMITVANKENQQLQLSTNAMLMTKDEFKMFLTVMHDTCPIGYHLLRKCPIRDIKLMKFINWLTKEKIYFESESHSITKTSTIGYLTKLHPCLTNHTNLKPATLMLCE